MDIDQFLRSFIPHHTMQNEWEYRKHKLLVSVCFVNALYSLLFLPTSIIEQYWGAVAVIIPNIIVNSLLPFLLKKNIPLSIVANLYIITLGISLSAIMAISGGVFHTATDPQLMVLMPVMALLFLNFRWAIFWFVIAVVIVAAFGILQFY